MARARKGKTTLTAVIALALITALCVLLMPGNRTANADPPGGDLARKSREALRVSREIEQLDKELAISTEAYRQVKVELDEITAKVDESREKLFEIKKNLKKRQGTLNGRITAMYKNGRTGTLEVLLLSDGVEDFFDRVDGLTKIAEYDGKLVKNIKITRDEVKKVEREYAEQQRRQRALVNQEGAKKTAIETKLAERRALLEGLNAEIMALLEQEWARLAAESEEMAREVEEGLGEEGDDVGTALVRTSLMYLGVPYHYAADGPGTCPSGEHEICFDCSGFTQYIYGMNGINIPSTSMTQRHASTAVKRPAPGDLVFFGSSTSPHHVGMYVGQGKYVHAPHTGDVVRVAGIGGRSDICGYGHFR